MQLEGVVTNVTAFGAFVDVGVHQDGLVHISELSDRFVKDPREVVKAGDVVKVRVKDVDIARKRIALTMKSGAIDRSAAGSRAPIEPTARPACRHRHRRPDSPRNLRLRTRSPPPCAAPRNANSCGFRRRLSPPADPARSDRPRLTRDKNIYCDGR